MSLPGPVLINMNYSVAEGDIFPFGEKGSTFPYPLSSSAPPPSSTPVLVHTNPPVVGPETVLVGEKGPPSPNEN